MFKFDVLSVSFSPHSNYEITIKFNQPENISSSFLYFYTDAYQWKQ